MAKYQHYTPQLHLRKFHSDAPKNMVWTYDKVNGRCWPSRVENTGGQQYFYAVRDENGKLDHSLDELLQTIENAAATGYERLLAGEIPQGQERADFATFIATLHTRSPGMIRCAAEMHGKLLQSDVNAQWATRDSFERHLDEMDKALGTQTTDRDGLWEFWQNKDGFTIGVDHGWGLGAISASDDIQEILYERNWYLLTAAEDFFVTSDQPVERSAPAINPFTGDGGFRNPAVQVTMPLSPQLMLMITGSRAGTQSWALGGQSVWMLNEIRARYAERNIWSHVRDDRVAALVEAYKESRLTMSFSNQAELAEVDVERGARKKTQAD